MSRGKNKIMRFSWEIEGWLPGIMTSDACSKSDVLFTAQELPTDHFTYRAKFSQGSLLQMPRWKAFRNNSL